MKSLSLFDQLQIRLPIRARTNVRRSDEAGAAAVSVSKSGFGGSLLTNIASRPQIHSDTFNPFNRNGPVAKDVHIERYKSEGWARILLQSSHENAAVLLLSCWSSLVFDDFLTLSLLGIRSKQA